MCMLTVGRSQRDDYININKEQDGIRHARAKTHSYEKAQSIPLSERWCSPVSTVSTTQRSSTKCLAHTHAPHRPTGTAHPTQPAQPHPFPPSCCLLLLLAYSMPRGGAPTAACGSVGGRAFEGEHAAGRGCGDCLSRGVE